MRQELRVGNRSIFSRSLQSVLHETLDAGEQAILFLNRRGTRTFVMCRDCGHVEECERCETPLTYHENASLLICHHCNQRHPIPEVCPEAECQSKRIKYFGSGTQRIEDLVQQIAPRARMLRWDADTTNRKGSHEAILKSFANHEADILVGTQMIAKGLDLPAAQHDYAAFYEQEILFRRENGYPPIIRMGRLVYWDKKQEKAQAASEKMAATLRHRQRELGLTSEEVSIMGPLPAFFARFGGYYRWQILVRAADPTSLLRGLDIPFGWG